MLLDLSHKKTQQRKKQPPSYDIIWCNMMAQAIIWWQKPIIWWKNPSYDGRTHHMMSYDVIWWTVVFSIEIFLVNFWFSFKWPTCFVKAHTLVWQLFWLTPFFPSPSSRSWLIALLHGLPFLGLTFVLVACPSSGLTPFQVFFALFQGLLCVCFGLFFPTTWTQVSSSWSPRRPSTQPAWLSLSTLLGLALPLGLEPFVPAGEVPLPLGEVPLPLDLEPFAGEVLAELEEEQDEEELCSSPFAVPFPWTGTFPFTGPLVDFEAGSPFGAPARMKKHKSMKNINERHASKWT